MIKAANQKNNVIHQVQANAVAFLLLLLLNNVGCSVGAKGILR